MENGGASGDNSEGPRLQALIGEVIAAHAGQHPGIIAEAVVEQIAATYALSPRERHHRQQRKNHLERTRRVAHEVYRVLAETQNLDPGREIAARVLKSFLLTRRPPAATSPADSP